jgi:Family of unknown function (DUF6125)
VAVPLAFLLILLLGKEYDVAAIPERSSNMREIDKNELKELLLKCWMTHDGMWFYNCMQDFGIEKANRINKAAIKSLAGIEIERVRKAFGLTDIETFEDIKILFDAAFGVLTDDFMGFSYGFPSQNIMHWEMSKCFAYAGMKRLGVIDRYECGVIYRVACWFDSLGVKHVITPQPDRCLMHVSGSCLGDFRFSF